MLVFRSPARWVLALMASLLLPSLAAGSSEQEYAALDRAFQALESGQPAAAEAVATLWAHRNRLEDERAQRQREFDAAQARPLPAKARARLEQVRSAYEAGQGRLLTILREILDGLGAAAAPAGAPPADLARRAREGREILARLAQAARKEPLSADLAVRAPSPGPLALSAGMGTVSGFETSLGPVPPELKDLAEGLEGPIEVYEWVRNTVGPDFYHGEMRGALETWREESGNDADTASLLIQLLRAKGIPARFVRGTVEMTAPRLMAVTGTRNVEQAVRVLERAGIPHEAVLGAGSVTAVRLERIWAEAYLPYANYRGTLLDAHGKAWIPLDPGLKDLESPRGIDVVDELGLDPRALVGEYVGGPQDMNPLEFFGYRVAWRLADDGLSYGDALNSRNLVLQNLGLLPSALPYKTIGLTDVSYALPETLRHTVRFVGEAAGVELFDVSLPVADLLGRRLTLSYVPFDEEDARAVELYGGLTRTPPYLVELRPVVKSGGVAIAAGKVPVGAGVRYRLRVDLGFPGGVETVRNEVVAGNLIAVGLGGRSISTAEADSDQAAAILSRLAGRYLQRWSESDYELARLLQVAPIRPTVSVCFVMSDLEVGYADGDPALPVTLEWKGIAIDADLRSSAPVGLAKRDRERDFLLLSGLEGSSLEHRIFEDELGIPAVSTAKALQLAVAQGVEVLDITADDVDDRLPGLPLDEVVKDEVRAAVAKGFRALLPAAPIAVQSWRGVGYLLLDEETGEAAYQLQGGRSGGVTTPDPSEIPEEIRDPLADEDESPSPEGTRVARLVKAAAADFQEGTVGQAVAKRLKVTARDVDGYPVPGATVVFGVVDGGGRLVDPLTGETRSGELAVRSNERGEAEVGLVLGTQTGENPRYLCEHAECEEVNYRTQVGLNVVSVRSGTTSAEPFSAYGIPEKPPIDPADPEGPFRTYFKWGGEDFQAQLGAWYNMRFAARMNVLVGDRYGNPISNVLVRFFFHGPPVQYNPPAGWVFSRPATSTPGHLLRRSAYDACQQQSEAVLWGQCPGEAEELVVRTSDLGAFAYAGLGDSPNSHYIFLFGSTVDEKPLGAFRYSTNGYLCRADGFCPALPSPPVVLAGFRSQGHNALGNLTEAYPPGGEAEVTMWATALVELSKVVAIEESTGTRYGAIGLNRWVTEPLTDSEFRLVADTAGTQVTPAVAAHVGKGTYRAAMRMAGMPQLNTIRYEGKHTPAVIRLLPSGAIDPAFLDPAPDGSFIPRRGPDPARPFMGSASFSLWGVDAGLTVIKPSPILLDPAGLVEQTSQVDYRIEPAAFGDLLASSDVLMEVRHEDKVIASGFPAPKRVPADRPPFFIPKGLSMASDEQTARLVLVGVSTNPLVTSATGPNLVSPSTPLPVCPLLNLETPVVALELIRDPLNGSFCGADSAVRFTLCRDALVTFRIDGDIVLARVDGGPLAGLENVPLAAGPHSIFLPPGTLGVTDTNWPFTLRAVDREQEDRVAEAEGRVVNEIKNRSVLPVGRTFVKGVDLFDGHLVQTATDLKLPGRHLGLEMNRTYSSAGKSPEGVLGAGWSFNYSSRLIPSECRLVTVITAEGGSQVFREGDDGFTFTPQKGYHTRLVRNADLSYDFFDKAGNRHHFREPELATVPNAARRLEYIEEPHGDRTLLAYDGAGRVANVSEVHRGGGAVRVLALTYVKKGGFDRIERAEVTGLRLQADYEYDEFGNLKKATRRGSNLGPSEAAADAVEQYTYTDKDALDRHQLLSRVGPNGDRTDYEYYKESDSFPGEGPGLQVEAREEYVHTVREFPGGSASSHITEFRYDLSDAPAPVAQWKTTVRDPRNAQTLYVLNSNGSPLEIQEPLGKTTRMEWATDDIFKVKETDALGRVTRYGYDGAGNLTSERIVRPGPDDGEDVLAETLYAYDGRFNKLAFKQDAEGRQTSYTIDEETGDLLQAKDAEQNETRYEYDGGEQGGPGLLTRVTSPRGHETVQGDHDDFGNARTLVDPLGNRTTREYDLRGRLTGESDTTGRVLEQQWDGLDRLVSKVRRSGGGGSDDQVTATEYYPAGQPRKTTGPGGAVTEYMLDGLNRVISTRTSGPGLEGAITTETSYDGNGNKTTETDGRGVVRRNTYDELNRLTRIDIAVGPDVGPTGTVATYGYDLAGNKLFETNVAGLRTDFEYDELYRVKKKLLPESGPAGRYVEEYGYDRVGNRTSATDANGHATRFRYDGLNRVVRTENALGQVTTATYDDPEDSHVNKSEEHDETRGLRTAFTYDALNRELTRTVHLEGAGSSGEVYLTTTAYDDGPQHTVTVTNPRGFATRTRMDGLDHPIEQVVDPGGLDLVTRFSYDGLGNKKSTTDPEDRTTVYGHDALGRLTRVTDAKGETASYTYDGEGLKISETDRRQVGRSFSYDNLGRLRASSVLAVATLSGVPWSQETRYLDKDKKRIEIDARNHQTIVDLDGLGRAVKETDPQGHYRTFRWDGMNKREETDKRPQHFKTLFDYDALNRLVKVANALDQTVTIQHDDPGNRTIETDRRAIRKVSQMDPLGRLVSVLRAEGLAEEAILERNTYDPTSNMLTSTDAQGNVTRFIYDPANRPKARTDRFGTPTAATTAYEYDRAGNQTEERDQRAADLGEPFSAKKSYDQLNRLETVTDAEGHVTRYGYDAEGNRTSVQEPAAQVTTYDYDELGKLTRVTQPTVPVASGGTTEPVTSYGYDRSRNRIRQADASGHVVTMEYDQLNRLTAMTQDPAGFSYVTRHEYDENGNETVLTDPKGQKVTSTYDELNRLKTKAYAFAPSDPVRPWRHVTGVAYGYDSNDNFHQVDETVASGTDPPVVLTTIRDFDNLDRLKAETTPLPDGGDRTITYTYYPDGTRKTLTDPAGLTTFYEYDGPNRLKATTTAFGTPAAATTTQTYWPDDLLKTVTYPNGVSATHAYDKADRLTSLVNAKDGTTVSSYGYAYDPNGNRLSQVEVNGGTTETTSYTYDGLNRLASVTYPDKQVTYGYDAVGNRQREEERDPSDALLSDKQGVFDAVNRLTSLTDVVKAESDSARLTSFEWDANGNQLSKTVGTGPSAIKTDYRYDLRDKLVEVDQGSSILSRFQYCYDGKRTKKIGEEGIRLYVYDQTSLLAEYDDAGHQVAKYDYGSDRLISLFRRDEPRRYFHLDGLRSVTNLTDDQGSIAASYHLDAWGNYRFPTELDRSKNRFGFTGYELDKETGLYNAKARYFDPQLGRFLSQDSFLGQIDNPPTLHRYFYGHANPTRYVDPTGHASINAEDLSTNELRSRVAAYDPGTGKVRREEPCGAGNTCIIPRTPDPLVQGALRTAGGDKDGALSLIDGLKATNNRSFAVVVTEDSDYESNGRLDTSKVYRQFLNQVGGHAGVLEGLREEFQAALEGAVPGQARDISFLYNVAYEYSAAKSYALAEQDAQQHFGPDFIQRNAHLVGQWGAAPRDVSTSAAVALGADTLTAASAGLGIYRFGAGLVADGAASGAAAPNTGLRELHVGPYEESTARGLGTVRDKLTGDHIPSFAAVRRNVEKQLGRRLTDVEAEALRSKTTTITVPESIHRGQSPTYGGRNTPAQIEADSANLAGAAQRDAQALYKAMVKEGRSPTEIQMALEKLHQTNREGGIY